MKKAVKQIMLQILLLQEQFSDNEINEAVNLLEEAGISSSVLFVHLSKGKKKTSKQRRELKSGSSTTKLSKVVLNLQEESPGKFEVLSEFETSIREGVVLIKLDDIRKLGEGLTKNFGHVKSRNEAINKLMAALATLTLDEIQDTIQKSLSLKQLGSEDSEFQQLAQFIISGKRTS